MIPDLRRALLVAALALCGASCTGGEHQETPPATHAGRGDGTGIPPWLYIETGDLSAIRARGVLRVIAPRQPELGYLPRGDRPYLEDRELARGFARQLGVDLAFVPVTRREELLTYLIEGKGDVTVGYRTPNNAVPAGVALTVPFRMVRAQIVARAADTTVTTRADLSERRVAFQESSPFAPLIARLRDDIPGIEAEPVPEHLVPLEILEGVAVGTYDLALVESQWTDVARSYDDRLRVAIEFGKPHRLHGAVRAAAADLRRAADQFLVDALSGVQPSEAGQPDLPGIRQRGVLRVLTVNADAVYFMDRGEPRGFDYELVRRFAEAQEVRVRMVVAPEREDLIPWLVAGRGDLVAAPLVPEEIRATGAVPSHPYKYASAVGIAPAAEEAPSGPEEVEESVPYCWATRTADGELRSAVDEFIRREYRGTVYNILRRRYLGPRRWRGSEAPSLRAGSALSPYDDLAKRYAERYGFDWRLLVALMYQESRFDPKARSAAGAIGLLQVLPSTAREFGLSDPSDPEQGFHAGVRYLDWLRGRFPTDMGLPDRMAFTIAAYNAGYGHVADARRVAARNGWDTERWFDNVERAMLLLARPEVARSVPHGYCRGSEPVHHVREILERFRAYIRLTEG